jgi:hypothetical protein
LPTIFACLFGEIFLAMIGAGFGIAVACLLDAIERRQDPSLRRPRPAWAGAALAAVALAFGVGAVVIVPAAALLGGTERAASLSRDLAEICSLHPLRMIEFVAPQSMGDAYSVFPAAAIVGEPRLDGLPLSYSMYLGASVAGLALAAFGRKSRLAWGLGITSLAVLLIAFGRYTPVHGIFRRIALPLSYMRYPEKYTIVFVTLVALLAALGADRILSDRRQPWRRTGVLLLALLTFAIVAATTMHGPWMAFALHGALMGAIALVALLAVEFLAARRSRMAPSLLVLLVAFDLALAVWPLQTFGPRQIAARPPTTAVKLLDGRPPSAPPPRIYRANQTSAGVNRFLPSTSNPEIELKLGQTLITNTANVWGIATLPGYDAAIPAQVDDVWSRGLDVGQDALRLLGAEYAILPVTKPRAAADAAVEESADARPGLVPLWDPLPGARVYKVPNTLPRAYWARHAEVMSDNDALARLYRPDVVAGTSVLLAPESNLRPPVASPGRAGSCTVELYDNQRIVASCSGEEPGILVFVEQFDRGWHATVDGKATPLGRANLIMRALPLGPGSHRIVLEYRTPGLVPGSIASLVSLLLVLFLALRPAGRPTARATSKSAEPIAEAGA